MFLILLKTMNIFQKNPNIYFKESLLKMMKNAFYFILKALSQDI